MERPDLEQMMHEHEEFARDALQYQQKVGECMWVVYQIIMDEHVAIPVREKPEWSRGAFVFHYHKNEVDAACREYQRYYVKSRRLH